MNPIFAIIGCYLTSRVGWGRWGGGGGKKGEGSLPTLKKGEDWGSLYRGYKKGGESIQARNLLREGGGRWVADSFVFGREINNLRWHKRGKKGGGTLVF